MEARLPMEKVTRMTELIESFLHRKSCTKRELLSLLGHLNYACRVIYPGRAFVSYLIRLSCTVKELHHHIKLSNECRLDLKLWYMFLQNWNGISLTPKKRQRLSYISVPMLLRLLLVVITMESGFMERLTSYLPFLHVKSP